MQNPKGASEGLSRRKLRKKILNKFGRIHRMNFFDETVIEVTEKIRVELTQKVNEIKKKRKKINNSDVKFYNDD